MNNHPVNTFELGPIRPPSEAYSILLRLTRNCPWNRCAFCPVYKGENFSFRSVEDIIADIDLMAYCRDAIESYIDENDFFSEDSLAALARDENIDPWALRQVAFWMNAGLESLFLQDADSMIMKTDDLVKVLLHIRKQFPSLTRVTTYARAHTVSRKSAEEMQRLFNAGLNRIHMGMESGSDEVLKLIQKGVTAERQIDAGRKAMDAGFEVSFYVMPGSGGKELSDKNARESARVINAVNPTFIRLRSTIPVPGTPLFSLMEEGKWTPLTEEEKVREIRLFIQELEGITGRLTSDHIMNLLEDVEGDFPHEKEAMLEIIDRFLSMDPDDREVFITARRIGRARSFTGFMPTSELVSIRNDLKKQFGSLDEAMMQILTRYI